jgi:hypothetical protein
MINSECGQAGQWSKSNTVIKVTVCSDLNINVSSMYEVIQHGHGILYKDNPLDWFPITTTPL